MRKVSTDDCWLFAGSLNTDGYGTIFGDGRSHRAHRVMYENHTGKSLDGFYSDHLCRVRSCINPDHIDPVDNVTNIMRGEAPSAQNARKTHCAKGHPLAPPNLYKSKNGWRICKACHTRFKREYRARLKAKR